MLQRQLGFDDHRRNNYQRDLQTMTLTRRNTLANTATALDRTEIPRSAILNQSAESIDQESNALLLSVYLRTNTIKDTPLGESVRSWAQSLRNWAKFHHMINLSPVEQVSLLVILQLLRTSIDAQPSLTESLAVSTGNHLSSYAPVTLLLSPWHPFSRQPGLWIL